VNESKGLVDACQRVLIVLADDVFVRNTVRAGAFDRLDQDETLWVASERLVSDFEPLAGRPGWLGTVGDPEWRSRAYRRLELVTRVSRRTRSRTLAVKTAQLPRIKRALLIVAALPGVRRLVSAWLLRRAGLNPNLHRLLERERPTVIVAPSGGNDALVNDAVRSARVLGITSLVLIHNWDGLTSKGSLPVAPDVLAVWGEQSVEHADRVHDLPRERVRVLGAPSLDHYFRSPSGLRAAPFQSPYALFAGCYAAFDEREPVEALDRAIHENGLDLTLVYRPHPHRAARGRSDFVDERRLDHVVLDPTVREAYERRLAEHSGGARSRISYPPLEGYPPLLENAVVVVCPLSTMVIESAIMGRRVLAIAYHDGVHNDSPATTIQFDHFERLALLPGVELVQDRDQLEETFLRAVAEPPLPRPNPAALRYWIHSDRRSYADRLHDVVTELSAR
jgi:hypothetical protein